MTNFSPSFAIGSSEMGIAYGARGVSRLTFRHRYQVYFSSPPPYPDFSPCSSPNPKRIYLPVVVSVYSALLRGPRSR